MHNIIAYYYRISNPNPNLIFGNLLVTPAGIIMLAIYIKSEHLYPLTWSYV